MNTLHKTINPLLLFAVLAGAVSIFLALFISLQAGIAAALFSIIAWWVWEYPEEGLLLLIVLSPVLPVLKATQTIGTATLIKDVIILALCWRTFIVPLFNKTLPYRRNIFLAPVLALATWAIIEAVRAPAHTLAVLRLRDILLYMALYVAVLYLPHTARLMRARFLWFIASLIAVVSLGILQLQFFPDSTVLRFDPARQIWIPRMGSTFGHPTPFAEFIVTAEMLCIGYLLAGYKKAKQSVAVLALGIATLPALYYTYTRASWIAFVLGVCAIGIGLFITRSRIQKIQIKKLIRPILIAIALIMISAFGVLRFSHVGTFLQTSFDPTYASNADRFSFVIQLIAQTSNTDALIGKGLGSSITQTPSNVNALDIASGASRSIQVSKDATLVDNQYLKTFIEMGIIGVVFTLWIFWRFALASLTLIRHATSGITRMLGIAGIGFITAFAVQALFVDIWDVYPTNAIFWIMAALISQAGIWDTIKNN